MAPRGHNPGRTVKSTAGAAREGVGALVHWLKQKSHRQAAYDPYARCRLYSDQFRPCTTTTVVGWIGGDGHDLRTGSAGGPYLPDERMLLILS